MNCIVIIPGYDRVRSNWIGLNCVLKFALPTAGSHDQRAIYKMAIVIDLSKAFADGHFKKYFRAGVTGSYWPEPVKMIVLSVMFHLQQLLDVDVHFPSF